MLRGSGNASCHAAVVPSTSVVNPLEIATAPSGSDGMIARLGTRGHSFDNAAADVCRDER